MRQHDADLCERIRRLEERVRELEARPSVIAYPFYPSWWQQTAPPYWTVWNDSGTVTTGPNVSIDSNQSSYTLTDSG